MAYGIYLVCDQTQWFRGNFSATNKLTGTIYTDKSLTTAKDLTGYTITIRLHKANYAWGDRFNKTADIVVAANGTWEYAVATGEMPPPGLYAIVAEISKSGDQETTLNRQELYVLEGPAA